jgi:hypothetical protein
VLNAGGSLLLVVAPDEEPFQVHRDEVLTDAERHGCACCS